jgi:hypothetical protein
MGAHLRRAERREVEWIEDEHAGAPRSELGITSLLLSSFRVTSGACCPTDTSAIATSLPGASVPQIGA